MIKECNKSIQQKRMHKKRAGIYNAKKKKNQVLQYNKIMQKTINFDAVTKENIKKLN